MFVLLSRNLTVFLSARLRHDQGMARRRRINNGDEKLGRSIFEKIINCNNKILYENDRLNEKLVSYLRDYAVASIFAVSCIFTEILWPKRTKNAANGNDGFTWKTVS